MEKSKSACTPKENLLIVGASSGLAQAFIRSYGDEFLNIVAHCHSNEDDLRAISAETNCALHVVRANLSEPNGAAQLIEFTNKTNLQIDGVIFFAAPPLKLKRFNKTELNDLRNHLNVQVETAFLLLQNYLPKMATLKRGKVVFILSSVVEGAPPQGMADYVVGKYAMLGLMKAAAAEYASKNLCINAISPSMIETRFLEQLPGVVIEQHAESHPRGSNGKPSDIVPIVRFLLSSQADYITGQNVSATGGA